MSDLDFRKVPWGYRIIRVVPKGHLRHSHEKEVGSILRTRRKKYRLQLTGYVWRNGQAYPVAEEYGDRTAQFPTLEKAQDAAHTVLKEVPHV